MKKRLLSAIALIATVSTLMLSGSVIARAAPAPEYSISIACSSTETTAIGSQTVMNFNYAAQLAFKNYVEAASSGKIQVNIYANSSLGNASEILLQCMQGIIEVSTAGDSDISNYYPNLQVFSIPYSFNNRLEFYDFLDSDYVQQLNDDIAAAIGVRIISAFDNGGFRNFSNNVRPIHTAEDLKGLKIRCMQSAAHVKTMEALGAIPTALAFSELYSAMQTGVVDGQENSPLVMFDNSLYEQQKYYSLDGHMVSPAYIIVNEEWLRSLPADLQQVILDGGTMAQTAARGIIASSEGIALDLLNQAGVDVYSPTAEEKETFRIAQVPVLEWLRSEIGDEPANNFMTAIEEVKTAGTTAIGATAAASTSSANVVPYIIVICILGIAVLVLAMKLKKKPSNNQE